MATPRKKTFRVKVTPPAKGEPAVLTDRTSWCWKLLANEGALLNATVKHAAYPGVGLKARGHTPRMDLYAVCVCHVIMESVEAHAISPTYQAIADALNEAEIWTYSGNRWERQDVYKLLLGRGLLEAVANHRHLNNLAFNLRIADTHQTTANIRRWPS